MMILGGLDDIECLLTLVYDQMRLCVESHPIKRDCRGILLLQ